MRIRNMMGRRLLNTMHKIRLGGRHLFRELSVPSASSTSKCDAETFTPIEAAVARGVDSPFTVERLLLSPPRDDEVVVRLVSTGVCHTDIAVKSQHIPSPFPIVLGHEGAGIVERVGERVSSLSVGDHVIMSYGSCGSCPNCLQGNPPYCYHHRDVNFSGSRRDGTVPYVVSSEAASEKIYGSFFKQSSFATHCVATEQNTLKVSKNLDLPCLAPLGCGIQTGAGVVMNSLQAKAGSSIAVFGCGSVGLSSVMAASVVGCTRIIAIDLNEQRLTLASELGATHTLVPSGSILKEIQEICDGGCNYAIDTTGVPSVLETAAQSLRPMGVAVLVGGSVPGSKLSIDMTTILLGRTVRGAIQGDSVSKTFLPKLIDLHCQGNFPFEKLITYYDSLSSINDAVADSLSGKTIKPVIRLS